MAYVYMIDGEMGAGKTSMMSLLAAYFSRRFDNLTVWSNYGLQGSRPFTSYRDFLTMASLPSSLALVDEGYMTFDARNFGSKGQINFTQLLYYLRKLRITVMFSAVDMDSLDNRIRKIIDVYVFARKRGGYHHYYFYEYRTMRLLKRVQIPTSKMKFLLQQLNLYKTWKIVRPIELPDKDFHAFVDQLDIANDLFYTQASR